MSASWLKSLFSALTSDFIEPTQPQLGDELCIRLRVARGAPIAQIQLRFAPEGSARYRRLSLSHSDAQFDHYQYRLKLQWPRLCWRFLILTETGELYHYNAQGLSNAVPVDQFDFRLNAGTTLLPWVMGSVFYQIFPDRFANGSPELNHQAGTVTRSGETIEVKTWQQSPSGGFDFFNGDLEGIRQQRAHLSRLGINALYLTPVFTAPSNHKYDVEDYYQIDPHFGTNQSFAELRADLAADGIRLIIDGVFNHTGWSHRWFNRFEHYPLDGAYNRADSPYASFYLFKEHPTSYVGWFDFDSLPKLNYRSQALRDAVYRDPDSVIQHWLAEPYQLAGWRFDVANMQARCFEYQANLEVWREVRAAVKPRFPDAYLLGEHFYDGSDLIQGDALDGIMNYPGFHFPIYQWLSRRFDFSADGNWQEFGYANFRSQDFVQQLTDYLAQIPWHNALMNYNFLNCHDRPRLITLLQGNREQERTAILFLFSYVGVPALYYGDETGLEGGRDPDCRRPMPWDESSWTPGIFDYYQRLIQLRRQSPALQQGALCWLEIADDRVVFSRFLGEEHWLVVLCRQQPQPLELDLSPLGLTDGNWESVLDAEQSSSQTQRLMLSGRTNLYRFNR